MHRVRNVARSERNTLLNRNLPMPNAENTFLRKYSDEPQSI